MIRITIGFIILVGLPTFLATTEQDSHSNHSHQIDTLYYAGGVKAATVERCGEKQLRKDTGEYVPLAEGL